MLPLICSSAVPHFTFAGTHYCSALSIMRAAPASDYLTLSSNHGASASSILWQHLQRDNCLWRVRLFGQTSRCLVLPSLSRLQQVSQKADDRALVGHVVQSIGQPRPTACWVPATYTLPPYGPQGHTINCTVTWVLISDRGQRRYTSYSGARYSLWRRESVEVRLRARARTYRGLCTQNLQNLLLLLTVM